MLYGISLSPVRARLFSRFLIRCAVLLLALAVVQHRSPRLGSPASVERIGEKKPRVRAVKAAILRTRGPAEKAASAFPERRRHSPTVITRYRTPDAKLAACAPRARPLPRLVPSSFVKHIPRMGSDDPPRA
jgi:hypothetical protein